MTREKNGSSPPRVAHGRSTDEEPIAYESESAAPSISASRSTHVAVAVLSALAFLLVALAPADLLGAAIREDGFIEYLGALAWFGGSLFFAATAARAWRAWLPLNAFWLSGLALMCLLAAGEEISWGQRILGYSTPAVIAESNLQGEMNFHNLAPLDLRVNADGEKKTGWSRWLTFNRVGTLIWLGYLVALPLAVTYSRPAARFARCMRVPSAPIWIATAGAVTYLAFAWVVGSLDDSLEYSHLRRVSANEVKETVVGLLFFLAAWSIFCRSPSSRH